EANLGIRSIGTPAQKRRASQGAELFLGEGGRGRQQTDEAKTSGESSPSRREERAGRGRAFLRMRGAIIDRCQRYHLHHFGRRTSRSSVFMLTGDASGSPLN